jgi:hypothetical protein
MTHRENVLRKLGLPKNTHLSINELAHLFNVPIKALEEVRDRGYGAWKNNIASVRVIDTYAKNPNLKLFPRKSRLSKEQWSMARIYSFLDKGKDYYTADADIAKKYNI